MPSLLPPERKVLRIGKINLRNLTTLVSVSAEKLEVRKYCNSGSCTLDSMGIGCYPTSRELGGAKQFEMKVKIPRKNIK